MRVSYIIVDSKQGTSEDLDSRLKSVALVFIITTVGVN